MEKVSASHRADFALSEEPCDGNIAQLLPHDGRIMVRDAE